jgi:hypothetical protein
MDVQLTLKDVEVVFANLVDEGFGKSITINATDPEVKKAITKWVKENKIGKKEPGVANFKEYEGKQQYAFKINDYTQFGGVDGLTKENLGFGATVSLIAKAFSYDNKFGKGTSGVLTAVVVKARAKTGADADLASLIGDEEQESLNKSVEDQNRADGYDSDGNKVPPLTDEDAPLSISDIPF